MVTKTAIQAQDYLQAKNQVVSGQLKDPKMKAEKLAPKKTINQLNVLAQNTAIKSPRPRPEWVEFQEIRRAIMQNRQLNSRLIKIAYKNGRLYRAYLNIMTIYTLNQTHGFRRLGQTPSLNLNDPRNPNNPNNLMLNPDNILNNQFIDQQAAILLSINEETIENLNAQLLLCDEEENVENLQHNNLLMDWATAAAAEKYLDEKDMDIDDANRILNLNSIDPETDLQSKLLLAHNPESKGGQHSFAVHAAAAFVVATHNESLEKLGEKLEAKHAHLVKKIHEKDAAKENTAQLRRK